MNAPLIVAGALGLLAAAIHGGVGEMKVVRRLWQDGLPATALGGPRMTRAMVHVTWHITTMAFLMVGAAMLVAGVALDGDTAQGIALVCAAAFTGFAAVALGLGGATLSFRGFFSHPGPLALTATAAMAWWGALV